FGAKFQRRTNRLVLVDRVEVELVRSVVRDEEVVSFRHHDRVVRAATAWLDYLGAALSERGLGTPQQYQGRREKNDAGCQDAIPGCLQHRSTPIEIDSKTSGTERLTHACWKNLWKHSLKLSRHDLSRIQTITSRAGPGHYARERWKSGSCRQMADPAPGP